MVLELPAGIGEVFPSLLTFCLGLKKSPGIHPNQGCQPGGQRGQPGNQSLAPLFQIVPGSAVSGLDLHYWLPQEGASRYERSTALDDGILNHEMPVQRDEGEEPSSL